MSRWLALAGVYASTGIQPLGDARARVFVPRPPERRNEWLLRPLPVWCALPRSVRDPKVMIVGSIAGHVRKVGGDATVISSFAAVDFNPPERIRSNPADALRPQALADDPGTVYALSSSVGAESSVRTAFLVGGTDEALDLPAMNAGRRRAITAVAGWHEGDAALPAAVQEARLVSTQDADDKVRLAIVGSADTKSVAVACPVRATPGEEFATHLSQLEEAVGHAAIVAAMEALAQRAVYADASAARSLRRLDEGWVLGTCIAERCAVIVREVDRVLALSRRRRQALTTARMAGEDSGGAQGQSGAKA